MAPILRPRAARDAAPRRAGYVAAPVRSVTPRLAVALALLAAGCATNGAAERAALERENARLRAEVEALRAELRGRPAAASSAGAESAAPPDAAAPQLEQVFVPRSRVSVEVSRDAASGRTTIASLWYRTADVRPLPRMEWMQVRAELAPDGKLDGAWLALERHGGRGSAQVESGRVTVDDRAFELKSVSHETAADALRPGRLQSRKREERATFALPPEALGAVATAISARFEAGSVSFDLTDEHLAAFAAVAARVGQASR
jgi:hypothetical protein